MQLARVSGSGRDGSGGFAHRLSSKSSTKEPKKRPRQSMVLLYVARLMSVLKTKMQ